MANAFGNVWPQYQAGYRQKYGRGASPPFVGAPIGAGQQETGPGAQGPDDPTTVYNPTWQPEKVVAHHAQQAAAHSAAAAAHTAAAHAASVQVRRAQPVLSPTGGYVFGNQPQHTGFGSNFFNALANTVAHIYRGTLGQHGGQPVQRYQQGGYVQGNQGQSAYEPLQSENLPSDISTQDLTGLSASGGGEPQSRYEMGGFSPGLTSIGGFTGAGGNAGSGALGVIGSLVSGLGSDMGKGQGGGGGGGGGVPDEGLGDTALANEAVGGGGGGGGMSNAQLGGLASGAISAFGKAVQEANAPVSVDPSKWANAPPQGATFAFPTLQRNTGATAPWA